ncbi:MAG: diguanylate cyclase, partial [Desulfobacterales bacterium]|nr:diguanylate cyclase [Desulfobacterales bacterium]
MEVKVSRPRILIVEDSVENIDFLMALLKEDYMVAAALNGAKAWVMATKNPPDLFLLDIVMPEMDGYELCQKFKSNEATRDIPVIFITSLSDALDEAKAFSIGAMDYITKPFSPLTVKARIKTHLSVHIMRKQLEEQNALLAKEILVRQQAEAELEQLNHKLKELSERDPLTKLYNRLKTDTVLEQEFERFKRYGHPFSVILLDIDKFKSINDQYGHQVGDDVLKTLADILRSHLRTIDVPGRWGGEEFLIICPQTNLEGARINAEKLRKIIDQYAFANIDHCSASFGVSQSQPKEQIKDII